jgi:hypothetical protein
MTATELHAAPSLQAIVATLLWSLSDPDLGKRCPRQLSMSLHQLRFVLSHPDAEPLLKDVAAGIVARFEDVLAPAMLGTGACDTTTSVRHAPRH